MTSAPLAALHAAYDLSVDDGAWVAGVAQAALPELESGGGCIAFRSQLRPDDVSLSDMQQVGGECDQTELASRVNELAGPHGRQAAFGALHWNGAAGLGLLEHAPIRAALSPAAIVDIDGFAAVDPSGAGVIFTFPHRTPQARPGGLRKRWERVAAHVAAGGRLRRSLGTLRSDPAALLDRAAAVLDPGGKPLDARGDARNPELRERLRQFARALDASHTRAAGDDTDSWLDVLTGLVEGRWTVVDCFDSDGRRFYVAHSNPPETAFALALGPRERQVLAYAAMGHSNKFIAWELGLSPSTVSATLRQVSEKLHGLRAGDLLRAARGNEAD